MTEQAPWTTATARYRVTEWTETTDPDSPEVPLSRAHLAKTYEGDLSGSGRAEILICATRREGKRILGGDHDLEGGYIGRETVTATLDGRSGTFVVQHGGTQDGREHPETYGRVVPGSATGRLRGLRGHWTAPHDQPVVRLRYRFAED